MSEVLEYIEANYRKLEGQTRESVIDAFEAGQQSQQSKIDAITKQRDSFIKAHHIAMNDVCEHKAKIDELQGRIDDALNTLCKLQYSSGERIYNDVGNILKGNKDGGV